MTITREGLSSTTSDIQQCNNEPLSFIGSVQSHGALIFFTLEDHRIQSATQNVSNLLGINHRDVISAKIEHVLGSGLAKEIDRHAKAFPWPDARGIHLGFELGDRKRSGYLFESDGLFGFEIESRSSDEERGQGRESIDRMVRKFMLRLKEPQDIRSLSKSACAAIREITGMDRVMMYRFLPPHWHGQVIAEDRVIQAHSYDQHRFPASDIPRPARDLYLRNSVRVIADVDAETFRVEPGLNPLTKRPLDLSDSRIRAVSPIHLEYLRNMGVKSSFSVAVTVDENLWGLFACHHMTPTFIDSDMRHACELIANAFSAQVALLERVQLQRSKIHFDDRLKDLFVSLQGSQDPVDKLFRSHQDLTNLFGAGGLAYLSRSKIDFAGLTPPRNHLETLGEWLRDRMKGEHKAVFSTECLAELDSRWEPLSTTAAGILAILTPGVDDGIFLLTRPEEIQTVVWGGDPRKQLDKKNFSGRINPRASFEAWEEVILNRSQEWQRFEIEGISFIRDFVFDMLVYKDHLILELTEELKNTRK